MRPDQRIITHLPIEELWDDAGPVAAMRQRDLSSARIRELLRTGPIHFAIVEVGSKPRWISGTSCFDYWKEEVSPHLADPGHRIPLEAFPGEYCYFASEWSRTAGLPIVALERSH